jgi:photosystem II stability/assembly factor-like uncharacterized protein
MNRRERFLYRSPLLLLAVVAALGLAAMAQSELLAQQGPATPAEAIRNLRFREIGPAIMGGRVDDFAVVESNPNIVYVGLASGGVWKTTNGGITWEPIFDDQPVSTIGDVAVAPSNPSIVWVGTGEPNNRQSSSWGNGVYKSEDGGKTWQHMGLEQTHHIGRIVIHPHNPDIVYVAALGKLWGPNRERGVYKTTDGGRTWTQVLFVNEDTGVVDLAMDPESPNILYAAAYQRRRTVFGFAGSGPGSGLYRSTDGGVTWTRMVKGLPYDPEFSDGAPPAPGGGPALQRRGPQPDLPQEAIEQTGRIGLAIYRRNPAIVYAIIEHARGGVFRSEDRGLSWRKMSDTNPRPMYYSKIVVDPNNDLRIWVMGAPMYYSEDGGKTFVTNRVTRIHGDYHAMWINPADSNHMIVGSDGGIHWSYDAGRTWDFVNTLAIGQFYEIGVDMQQPYNICGGLQDNGSWCGPSRTTYTRGISNDEWVRVGGGDGFYVQIDPTDPNILYAESQDGNLFRRDLRTTESVSIRPREAEGEPPYRFQWNSPIVISAHDPATLYYGAQYLFKSTNRGDSWQKISPDLTTGQDRDKLEIMGRVPDRHTRSRHDGVQNWPCITTISESPRNPQVLWVGTDDGNLQVTRDGGRSWRNVADRVPGVPPGTYVSRVIASRHAEGRAYVTFDGHRSNDFRVYVYVTEDFGTTWKEISRGIPQNNGVANVIREHHRNPDLLFVGTEYGAYVSFDRGANWSPLKLNLPTVPVDDIVIHPRENDLILGTHGRSIWVLDDITPLEQLNARVLASDLHLFDIRAAIAWRLYQHKANTGHKIFLASNPPYGALIHYYLRQAPGANERVTITIEDAQGKKLRELEGTKEAGVNRVNWDLRSQLPFELSEEQQQALGFFGQMRGPLVDPGTYTVKVTLGSNTQSKTVTVEEDPRIRISPADRAARRQALDRAMQLAVRSMEAQRKITSLKNALDATLNQWRGPAGRQIPQAIRDAAQEFSNRVNQVHGRFVNPPLPLGWAGPPLERREPTIPQRMGRLYGALEGYTAAPTPTQLEELAALEKLVGEVGAQVDQLIEEDLAALNRRMNEAGIPHIRVATGGRPN